MKYGAIVGIRLLALVGQDEDASVQARRWIERPGSESIEERSEARRTGS